MNNSYFIITGSSRGIGEALSKKLLEEGCFVHGISRGSSSILCQYQNYSHHNYDLSNTRDIEPLIGRIFGQINVQAADMICLVNNAAMLEPLKPIEECHFEEISQNINTSLIAPIILTSCFIKRTIKLNTRNKIINVSSGSGTYSAPDMSVYCTAKAGLNMFTRCIGDEQINKENPVEIIAVDPGMVETEMQRIARGKQTHEFAMSGFFTEAYTKGQLQSVENLAKHLKNIIYNRFETGRIVNYMDS